MSLGKTFTNAIVREIGRNYGKAISNTLMGDSHSTPVRMVGSSDVGRMRGRTYRNKLDEALEKFTIKGTFATFNAGLNIHAQYFSLVEEANADGVLDISEVKYLMSEAPRVIGALESVKGAMVDNDDVKRSDKITEKIQETIDFVKLVHDSIEVEKFPVVIDEKLLKQAGLLTLVGLDQFVLAKSKVATVVSVLLLIGSTAWSISTYSGWYVLGYLLIYNLVSAMLIDSGYYGTSKRHNSQKALNSEFLKVKQSIANYLNSSQN
jgi:hypothetical protein